MKNLRVAGCPDFESLNNENLNYNINKKNLNYETSSVKTSTTITSTTRTSTMRPHLWKPQQQNPQQLEPQLWDPSNENLRNKTSKNLNNKNIYENLNCRQSFLVKFEYWIDWTKRFFCNFDFTTLTEWRGFQFVFTLCPKVHLMPSRKCIKEPIL